MPPSSSTFNNWGTYYYRSKLTEIVGRETKQKWTLFQHVTAKTFFFVLFGDYGIQVHHIPVISQISIFTVLKNNAVHTCEKIPRFMVSKSIQKIVQCSQFKCAHCKTCTKISFNWAKMLLDMMHSELNRNTVFLSQPLRIISTITLYLQIWQNKFFQPIPNKGYEDWCENLYVENKAPLKQYIPMNWRASSSFLMTFLWKMTV